MVGWHHRLDGNEFEQTPADSEGQGSLACYSPWGRKELDMTLATKQQRLHPQETVKEERGGCCVINNIGVGKELRTWRKEKDRN